MTELIGKIITARVRNSVFLFRLTDEHVKNGYLNDANILVNESTTLEKKLWFDAFELMEATKSSDMGLEFTEKQYNNIIRLCKQH